MNKEEYKKIEKYLSMVDIAYEILKINKKAMNYKDIAKIMLKDVGYISEGETPSASLNSAIGRDDRFSKHRGFVELKEWHNNIERHCCPKCGKEIKKDFKYCPYCKSNLEHYCRNCNKKMETEWKICPYCGDA